MVIVPVRVTARENRTRLMACSDTSFRLHHETLQSAEEKNGEANRAEAF